MDHKSETGKRKDKQVVLNVADLDIVRKDEAFWQRAVKALAKEQIFESVEKFSENDDKLAVKHPERVFCISCKCNKCMTFRKLIIGIHVENEAYNDLWEKLKDIICTFYTMLPTGKEDSVFKRKYQELQTDSCGIRWYSDASIDVKKNLQVAMGNYFSMSNEMTFIIVFNMLILRDTHQLFELLCLQLTSIILAYREGIKEMTKVVDGDEEYYKPEEFLNYILNGYDRITEIAETLTPLVIEMRDHLQKFSLTWQLINQTMYYRFLYVDIESRMADCILRLKDAVDADTYKNFVYRFIKFDEEMTQIGQVWEVALVALELYRKSTPEQISRVERIGLIRQIIHSIPELKEASADATVDEQALALNWIALSENEDIWHGVLNKMRINPHYKERKKHPCKCWACMMADGNNVPDICTIPGNSKSEVKKSNNECYHLSWAVFKHLPNRETYKKQFLHPESFCVFSDSPCQRIDCQVATNLVIGSYPLSFTRFLLRAYQPLTTSDREKFLKVPSQSLIRKFCLKKGGAAAKEIMQEADEINHSFLLFNMFWDDDDIVDPILRAGLAAALAENFRIDVKFPHKHIIFSYFYALFRTGDDIVMDLDWLEKVNIANLFKSFGVVSNIHDPSGLNNTPTSIEAVGMTLNKLKITAEVSGSSSNALDLVQFSMKEVAEKLSSISLTDDNNEIATEVLKNEIKKPLVEALKLAASNKKLEAELKSLQKEHNMLKDMVKGLEHIHGDKKEVQVTVTKSLTTDTHTHTIKCGAGHRNPSASPSSSTSASDMDYMKDSGNPSDCVCYYCTLFGKNQDLMNSRSTETRDRLRKRLHHLQSQKDFSTKSKNLKNISLLLKNGAAAAAATSPEPTNCSETTPQKRSNGNASGGASMKMKVELELQQRKKKANPPKPSFSSKPEEVKIQRATEMNLKSLENLVEYIEGPSSKAVVEQKKAEEAAAKKQQKKARQMEQKIRRQIDSHLETLNKMNSELHEVVIDAKQVHNQLSQLKSGKGKNKELKKVKTAEEKFAELKRLKSKLENDAKGLLYSIKELNPTVDLFQECSEMKTIVGLLGPPPPVTVTQQKPKPLIAPAQIQIPRPIPLPVKVQQQTPQPTKSSDDDPAKRMVTIRRINLPHAEPQVTVTAKGTTPDMDQLLYTFVNGQLVPASSLSPSAFQNGSIQLFMSSNGQTKMVVGNNQQGSNKEQVSEKSKKKQPPTQQAAAEKASEKPKKESKKKKEEQPQQPTTSSKKELKKTEIVKKSEPVKMEKKTEANVDKKKKTKKAYIDPEFAANPFKLLDDDQPSETDEEIFEDTKEIVENEKKAEEELKPNAKKLKEEKKAVKKQANVQVVQPVKIDKTAMKKNQQSNVAKGSKNDRKDSVTSASSNGSKDSKSKQRNPAQENVFKPSDLGKKSAATSQLNSNSIMDQLNRGVRVEGLRLPPGITLTKVAPSDSLGLKRESINKISQPMQDYSASPRLPEQVLSHGDPNGIIMVESNPHAHNSKPNVPADCAAVGKKKNKKKKGKSDVVENTSQAKNQQTPPDRIVTIKNPMFYNSPSEPMNSMMRNLQTPPFVSPMAEPHSAFIVRNENGMYTIRNPTFQSAFGATSPSATFAPRPQMEPVGSQFSQSQYAPFDGNATTQSTSSQPKCSSVIGSEMKNVLQRRKEQEFAANIDPYHQYGMRSQPQVYSHFGGSGVNFSNNGTFNDDKFMQPPSQSTYQSYPSSMIPNYDDLRLQPGQMLNSEVTIHNVTESKMFQNAKKTPPPIGMPRNGNMEGVGTLFGDLMISRPMAPSEMMNGNDRDGRGDGEPFKRYDFNNTPPKQPLKNNVNEAIGSSRKTAMSHVMGDDFDRKQNSTNSNSPISVTSLDEIYESGEQKIGNLLPKTSFYSSHHNFNDDKSSGSSSLFSSGM